MQGFAVRPVDVLVGQASGTVGEGPPRRAAQGRDRPGACGQLRGLRGAEGVGPPQPGGPSGDLNFGRIARSAACCRRTIKHLQIKVLRRPVESGQYLSIRYTERLAANDIAASAGSRGDSYDNALAETIIGLYKTELVRNKGPWKGLDDLELATPEWVDWFNCRRLFNDIGRIPPAEAEELHYLQQHLDSQTDIQTKQPA